eukprot:RCo045600
MDEHGAMSVELVEPDVLRQRLTNPLLGHTESLCSPEWGPERSDSSPISPLRCSEQPRDFRLSFLTSTFHQLRVTDVRHGNIITAVMFFAEPVDVDRGRLVLKQRLAAFQRFRSIVVRRGHNKYYWKEVDLDLTRHVVESELPPPYDDKALYDFVGSSFSVPLDPEIPLWRFHIFNNYCGPQGKAAMVSRISHEIGDGTTLVQVVLATFDPVPPVVPSAPAPGTDTDAPTAPPATTPSPPPGKKPRRASREPSLLWTLLTDPIALAQFVFNYAASTYTGILLLLVRGDSPTVMRLTAGSHSMMPTRRVAFSKHVELSMVQGLRRLLPGLTINDVLVGVLAGTLRRYMIRKDDPWLTNPNLQVRAVFPYNTRRGKVDLHKDPHLFGNRFTLLPLALPVNAANPYTLLKHAKERCDRLKHGPEAFWIVLSNQIAGALLPSKIFIALTHFLLSKFHLLFTNVPGPKEPVSFAGSRVTDFGFFVPSPFGLIFSVLSYCGKVNLGVLADPSLNCDPNELCECFVEELRSMEMAAEAHAAAPVDP